MWGREIQGGGAASQEKWDGEPGGPRDVGVDAGKQGHAGEDEGAGGGHQGVRCVALDLQGLRGSCVTTVS